MIEKVITSTTTMTVDWSNIVVLLLIIVDIFSSDVIVSWMMILFVDIVIERRLVYTAVIDSISSGSTSYMLLRIVTTDLTFVIVVIACLMETKSTSVRFVGTRRAAIRFYRNNPKLFPIPFDQLERSRRLRMITAGTNNTVITSISIGG